MKIDKRFWGIGLGLFAIGLRFVLGFFPQVTETIYSRGIYKVIRLIFDSIHSVLPFSALYLMFAILMFAIYWGIKKWRRSERSVFNKLGQILFSLLSLLGWIVFLFLFLWGFNYGRIPLATQLKITPRPLKLETVVEELNSRQAKLIKLRANIPDAKDNTSF